MKRTFFEYIGIADMEKIHSQILKWIFFNDNEAITENQKNNLLKNIFKVDDFEIKEVITEYKNIDIVFISENKIICIENKIKSSQHSDQLNKYYNTINSAYGKNNSYFFYLTLIDEKSNINNWLNISYTTILSHLKKIENQIQNNTDGIILKEYIKTLERFESTINDFVNKPNLFMNVFNEAHLTKKDKSKILGEKSLNEKFISENQLETILQKLYFHKVAEFMNLKNYYIVETHGNAIFGIVIKENIEINGKLYNLGFDYQGGAFKTMLISREYPKSNKKDLPSEIPELFEKIKNIEKYQYEKVNKPISQAYYSITKRKNNCKGMQISDFAKVYTDELNISKEIIKNEFKEYVC